MMESMADNRLDDRRIALEEAFFRKENERLRARLQAEREREAVRNALASEFGVHDDALLDRLLDLGIRIDTIEALVLAPLVLVAWADGVMDSREREAVLKAVQDSGMKPGSPGHALLEEWTQVKPVPELFESWRAYIASLASELSPEQRAGLEERILGQARAVAQAAGGLLGLASISREEEAVLAKLKGAFSS